MKAKTKLNSLLSMLIALAMLLGMLPAMSLTAFAAEPGISITGSTADSSGTGWSYVESTKTLTLSGYSGGYIQGSGLNTLNLVLEGTNAITVDDTNAKGIALGNNQNLNISGSGSLTINATNGSNLIYGIECRHFTMTSGTVTINANSSKMVYGVNANDSLSVTGGKLTANITGTSDGRGLYCKTGKLTVDSGAEVAVKVTNNGSNGMYGIYNEAYTASVTDNGDIELAGTVTITRDSGSTGSGMVYGIANRGSSSNTDGVISVTGGTVTVTNAYYGIAAFTKGHDTAFADVVISGGTVNVTSTTSDSLGIVSWNNGVTISGGTVTANTASSALWLFDQDSANKTGLVKITGDAKVSLTSTDYKALVVQEGGSTSSTRVHQINLTSGGSVTVKSTSSEETDYAFPVQGYFNLGSSTKITEGSFRSTPDGTNAGGGKLFQADSTTKQVVVAYSTLYTNAGAVSVNGHSFASDKLYYKNGSADTTNDSTDYNAHYDPATGILELKNYNSGPIIIGSSNAYDVTVKLTGTNTVTTSAPKEGVGNVCVGINITNADNVTFIGDGTLTVNTNAGSGLTQVFGIWLDRSAPAAENLTFQSGKVTVNVTAADTEAQVFGVSTVKVSAGGPITVAEGAELNVTLSSASIGLANGLRSKGNITLNGKTAITLTYTGSGSPSASNWTSVSGFSGDNKLNVGANAAITVNMPDTYSLTNGMGSAYYAAKSDSKIEDEDWTNAAGSEQYFENDSFLVTQSVQSGLGYADYKYEVITPLTFEDKADYDIPAGTKGTGYTATVALTATGGSGEYRYEFEGTKPSGLSINAENKLVYTRASVCDATTAIVKVTDKGGISKSITIDIGAVTATSPGTGTVPHIDNKTVPVGTDVTVPWPEGAISYQRFEDSTQVGSGDKSGYPSGMYIPAKSSPTTKTFMFKVLFPGGWGYSNDFTVTWTTSAIYTVTINAGANMTLASGNANQSGLSGAMTDTVYTAADGYYFPTDYSVSAVNGITVTRNSYTQITVSGTPTANTTITLTPATAKTKEATPTATFDAQGPDFGNLMNWPTGMKYSVDGGVTWTENTSSYDYKAIYNVLADKDIKVYKPASDPNTKLDSDIQTIDVTKAATPTGVTGVACTTSANNDGKLQNVTTAMQYKKSDTSTWTDCGGTEVTGLANGTYYVRIKYSGTVLASDNQTVTVAAYTAPKTLSSIAVTTAPAKVTYTAGEYFNTSGMVVTATYSDSSTKAVTSYTFAPTEALTTGDTSITISYTEGGVTKTATQAITVNAATKTLSSIAVTTAPTKVTYTAGEYFNTSGMVVTATYSDSSTKAVTGYTFTPTGALTTGDASITISYTEGGVTKTATQAITVNAVTKTLSSIAVTTAPTKVTYTAGEYFDTSGMVVTATYSDSSTKAVTSYTFAPTEALTTGDTSITISYTEGGVTKTATQAITVNAVLPEFTITFDGNGGTPSASGMTTTGQKLATLPTATRSGSYSFKGWYTAASGGTKITTDTVFSENATVYAQWTYSGGGGGGGTTRYTVSFETNGGSKVSSQSVTRNTVMKEPTAPTKENFDFDGWYSDKELKTKYDFSAKVTKSFTLYAKWTEKDNSINQIILTIGKKDAQVFGKSKSNDVAPKIEKDRTMLPARFVAENLGAKVEWNGEKELVTITGKNLKTDENVTILITIGAATAKVNGKEIKLDSPAFIENDRTYTPIRFISEELGASVEWVEKDKKVIITKPEIKKAETK
ncbi:MAG: stalk domain-containing protein [Clostridia bacterium]|nr:stalk domain-containing protein [Clostridia bacterium]